MTYTSWNDAPLMLSIPEAAQLIGISRSNMYALTHSNNGVPVLKIGGRYLVPKDALKNWIDAHTQS